MTGPRRRIKIPPPVLFDKTLFSLESEMLSGYRRAMTNTKKLMIFDLDGTLVDTADDLIDALNVSLEKQGIAECDPGEARTWIGHGARQMIHNALVRYDLDADETLISGMFGDFLEYYQANLSRHSRPFPGLIDALQVLADDGWIFAVCSNKHERYCRLLLDELDMSELFATVSGGDTYGVSKPDARHLLSTIEAASGNRERSVMVGDASTDVDAARAARLPVIGVTFGYTPVPMSELEPDVLLDRYRDLTPQLANGLVDRTG